MTARAFFRAALGCQRRMAGSRLLPCVRAKDAKIVSVSKPLVNEFGNACKSFKSGYRPDGVRLPFSLSPPSPDSAFPVSVSVETIWKQREVERVVSKGF
jgi:hypothetical protein